MYDCTLDSLVTEVFYAGIHVVRTFMTSWLSIFADVVENHMTELEDVVCLLKDLSVVNEVRLRFDGQTDDRFVRL